MWWIFLYLLEKNKGLLPNWTYRQSAKFLQCGIRWGWSVWKLWALNVCVIETDGLTSVGAKLASNCLVWKLCLLIFGILKKKKKSYESLWRYNLHSRAASSSQNLPRMKHQTVQRPSSKTSPGGTTELKLSTKESPKQVQMCFILAALQLKSMWFYFEQL